MNLPANAAGTPGDWTTPGLGSTEDDFAPKFFKTPNGVAIQELFPGSGQEAHRGDRVLVDFVLRRSNGYFIYGTLEGEIVTATNFKCMISFSPYPNFNNIDLP